MQTYGKKKRGNTIHGHECPICGEQDLSKSIKHRARQAANKDIFDEVEEYYLLKEEKEAA